MQNSPDSGNKKAFAVKIYTLLDPEGNPFYVGCTVMDIEKRLSSHLSEARQDYNMQKRPRKSQLIEKYRYDVSAKIMEMITIEAEKGYEALRAGRDYEIKWINHYKKEGVDLCNYANAVVKKSEMPNPQYVGKVVSPARIKLRRGMIQQ